MSKKEKRVRDIYGYTEKAAAARDAQFDIQEAQLSPDSSWPPKTEYFLSYFLRSRFNLLSFHTEYGENSKFYFKKQKHTRKSKT